MNFYFTTSSVLDLYLLVTSNEREQVTAKFSILLFLRQSVILPVNFQLFCLILMNIEKSLV